ncbi:hypothetical protein [Porphyromonas sp.]|uniref:hypothetical protein n=1 Tax=Porphyromonas sp. TaxID=1924944 RepID=UPI0026DAD850|nr:hypothetical protein [Porphyromonas sp.]MDO4695264.1 hypothetical protein [Porphyromonas sp.]MDO4771048.1 hypothetical protein [Porphyromonas sp.]
MVEEQIKLEEVGNYLSISSAHDAVNYLASHGIDAIIEHETLHNTMGRVPGLSNGVSVMVRSSDYVKALELLIASGRLPSSESIDNERWYSSLPFMRKAPLWGQLLVLILFIALIIGAVFLYAFLVGNIQ